MVSGPSAQKKKKNPAAARAHLWLGVAHGAREARDVVAETLSDLVLGRDGEGREKLEGSDL